MGCSGMGIRLRYRFGFFLLRTGVLFVDRGVIIIGWNMNLGSLLVEGCPELCYWIRTKFGRWVP